MTVSSNTMSSACRGALVVVQKVVKRAFESLNPTKVWHVAGFCALALPANEVSEVQIQAVITNKGMRKMNKCAVSASYFQR